MNGIVLFSARHDGRLVTVGLATLDELRPITRSDRPGSLRDVLRPSMLVAIRADTSEAVQVHALGWRVDIINTWITSALVGIDAARTVVRTSSGHAYGLGDLQDAADIPLLVDHLGYALRRWGFDDVRAL